MNDYFEFYNLPEAFHLDEATLKQMYYAQSREYHPDFHATALPNVSRKSCIRPPSTPTPTAPSPTPTSAWPTFCASTACWKKANKTIPPDFLMDMMELNEQLMELETEPDPAAVAKVENEVQAIADTLDAGIEPVLAGYEGLPRDHRARRTATNAHLLSKKAVFVAHSAQVANFAARS